VLGLVKQFTIDPKPEGKVELTRAAKHGKMP
jgi:hypothetical protein